MTSGVIGTNKMDAEDTVALLGEDLGPANAAGGPGDFLDIHRSRGAKVVDRDGWLAIDAAERSLGASADRERVEIPDWEGLEAASLARQPVSPT